MSDQKYSIKKHLSLLFLIAVLSLLTAGFLTWKNHNDLIEISGKIRQSFYFGNQLDVIQVQLRKMQLTEDAIPVFRAAALDSTGKVLIAELNSLKKFSGLKNMNGDVDSLQYHVSSVLMILKGTDSMRVNEGVVRSREKTGEIINRMISGIENIISGVREKETAAFNQNSLELETLNQKNYYISLLFTAFLLVFVIILMAGVRSELKIRVDAESELLVKSNELTNLNKNKDMLYSIIAHDLRSPFQPILTLAEILHSDYDTLKPSEIKEYGSKLNNIGRDVLALLDNLLEWSKIQTGKIHFSPESFMLKEKAEWVINNSLMAAESKRILLLNEIEENQWIFADMNMILVVLQNLISNAIKFTPPGGTIKVQSAQSDDEVVISVLDNGVGMTDERQKSIFKIGSNRSTAGTNRERGSGLGLLLCKELIGINGGRIWVESSKGKGSRFSFSIPDRMNES